MLQEELEEYPAQVLDEEEDLQLLMDKDFEAEEKKLKAKILFAAQELGAVKTVLRDGQPIQAYIRGTHCQASLKDIVKLLRSKDTLLTRLFLEPLRLPSSDLLELLLLHVEDKKLCFWLLALLSMITAVPPPHADPPEIGIIEKTRSECKQAMAKPEVQSIFLLHLSDCLRATPRLHAHDQMLQSIVLTLRNLLQTQDTDSSLHHHFVVAVLKAELLPALLYLLHKVDSALLQRLVCPVLQITYYVMVSLSPSSLYPILQIKETKVQSLRTSTSRHSRFMPWFSRTLPNGMKQIYHEIEPPKPSPYPNQRKQPQRKQVPQINDNTIPSHVLQLQTQSNRSLGDTARELIQQFFAAGLNQLIKTVSPILAEEGPRVTPQLLTQFVLLSSWSLSVLRHKQAHFIATNKGQNNCFSLEQIGCLLQPQHFRLVYRIIVREVQHPRKKLFKPTLYYSCINFLNEYLLLVGDSLKSLNPMDRRNANALLSLFFRHDIVRVLRFGFTRTIQQKELTILVLLTHSFFTLLRHFAQGKTLLASTNKIIKSKHNSNEQFEGEEEEIRFQQRKYNQSSQFTILADYEVIHKYLLLMKGGRLREASQELTVALQFYFEQLRGQLQGEWLLYTAQTLSTFHQLLCDEEFRNKNRTFAKLINDVCKGFIQLLRLNKLALVESLFRFSSVSDKDAVLSNYQQGLFNSQPYEGFKEDYEKQSEDQYRRQSERERRDSDSGDRDQSYNGNRDEEYLIQQNESNHKRKESLANQEQNPRENDF